MKKVTIIADHDACKRNIVEGNGCAAALPVGVELTLSDDIADACIAQYTCLVGYYVADATAVAALPTTGIADGSYCMVMNTQTLKFLTAGAWV